MRHSKEKHVSFPQKWAARILILSIGIAVALLCISASFASEGFDITDVNPLRIIMLGLLYSIPALPLAAAFLLFGYFRRRIRWPTVEILLVFAPLLVYWTLDMIGVVPFSVRDPDALEKLRDWQARGDFTKGYTVALDIMVCGVFAGLIPLPRVLAGESRTGVTQVSASVVILIAVALYFLTPAVYSP